MTSPSPNILLRYPVGSLVIWNRTRNIPNLKRHRFLHDPILARVVGKNAKQGNQRIVLDVLYIGTNPFNERVLYVRRLPSVGVDRVMSVQEWRQTRQAEGGE